jgi:hypothetical protein
MQVAIYMIYDKKKFYVRVYEKPLLWHWVNDEKEAKVPFDDGVYYYPWVLEQFIKHPEYEFHIEVYD